MAARAPVGVFGHFKMENRVTELFEMKRTIKMFREEQRWKYFQVKDFRKERTATTLISEGGRQDILKRKISNWF
jgi:hypothetical protein